jgi:tetratricopeptide (TPR) repeat protein
MLARAAHATAACLLLAVTSLAATAGCPQVVEPLSPPSSSSSSSSSSPSPSSSNTSRLVDVQPLEPDGEETAIAEESGRVAMDEDGMNGDDDKAPPCDGELDGGAMVKRANAFFLSGDKDGGVACLEEALTVDPQDNTARAALVKHYLDVNEGRLAHVYADELVREKPLDASARQMLGRALLQEKMWKEAIDAFALVVKAEPDNVYAHNNIGFAALQLGQLEVAREHLERCLSLEPQQGYMLNNLGVTYERLARFAEAHAAYSRAAELSPKYAQAALNRDRLQAALGQDDRILSAETLLRFREPVTADGVVDGSAHGADSDEAPVDGTGTGAGAVDPVAAAVDAATKGTGG